MSSIYRKLKEFAASQASESSLFPGDEVLPIWVAREKQGYRRHQIPYWTLRGYLTVHNGLLLYGRRIVIPVARQREILEKTLQGNLGIQRCRLSIMESGWWLGVSAQMDKIVKQCHMCAKEANDCSKLPTYPW